MTDAKGSPVVPKPKAAPGRPRAAKPAAAKPVAAPKTPAVVALEAIVEIVAAAPPAPLVAPEPEIVAAPPLELAQESADSKPVSEVPASVVETTIASTPVLPFQQTVKFMATLPTPPFKGYEELAAFGKANFEALVQANTILVKGVEELSKEIVSLTQASLETAATTAKAVFAAKTLKDVVSLQADYTKTSFDKFFANSSKLSELGVKVASDAIAPVTARVNVAVEKVMKPAA